MKEFFNSGVKVKIASIFSVLLLVGCGGGGGSSSSTPTPQPIISSSSSTATSVAISSSSASSMSSSVKAVASTLEKVNFVAPSLAGNLLGDSNTRELTIYLPKSYNESDALFPVIYYLPGFGDKTILGLESRAGLDLAFTGLNPAIVVIVDGVNAVGGSFYVDSEVTGKWATYLASDVVNYVDTHYRTVPNRRARGVAGHSMGGFGVINMAEHHSDVFGSAFAISPGVLAKEGLAKTQMFSSNAHIQSMVNILAPLKTATPKSALSALVSHLNNFDVTFDLAYGLAFAPLSAPPYMEYPFELVGGILVRNDATWAKWDAGFGAIHSKLTEFNSNFKALNGFGLDCGSNDEYQWIPEGCAYLDAELTAASVDHSYTVHSGMHQDQLPTRIKNVVLPFFSQRLSAK